MGGAAIRAKFSGATTLSRGRTWRDPPKDYSRQVLDSKAQHLIRPPKQPTSSLARTCDGRLKISFAPVQCKGWSERCCGLEHFGAVKRRSASGYSRPSAHSTFLRSKLMGRLYLTREASLSAITNRTAQFSEQDAAKLVYPAAERARHTHTHVATEVAEGMRLENARIAK